MIAEAIDTLYTLGWAFLVWFVLTALAATLALYAVIAIAWWTMRALWRGLSGPSCNRNRIRARRYARSKRDYREAA
ncbi:hypothetical protein OHA71_23650 [Streptomyces sp. NBC_00444]|uniref:hypothetical protein n=1 Tax=Streptomyces sp. NBC_00444 TaxID=2975744 RepID=UPI002E1AA5D6